jgi:acyl-CoA synthetase (AMP-forming)/AMP-acid ligase II
MEQTLAGFLREHARTDPDRTAIDDGRQVFTYGDLDRRSSQAAQALRAAGVRPQDRVALLDKNGVEFFDLLFGCSKLGAVDVTLNWRLTPPELAFVLEHSQARVLVVGEEFAPLVEQIVPAGVTVVRGGAEYDGWLAAQPADDPAVAGAGDDVVMQLYTSGTTGRPKGAMLTNDNVWSLVSQTAPVLDLGPSSQHLVVMPLFHIGGSGLALMGLYAGCRTVLKRDFVPADVIATLRGERITNALFVPAMLNVLTTVPGAADAPYPDLRSIVYGASPITEDVLQRAMTTFGCGFVQVYGLSETSGLVSTLSAQDHQPGPRRSQLLRSAGRPYPWVEVQVVDVMTEQVLPPGQVGEVWTRSPSVMKGYWRQPDATEEVMAADGWFRTGDAGYLDEQGYLYLTDRLKDMIVSGGENVYPAEVENVLAGHPAVADVSVIGVPDERWGETVKAVVVAAPGAELDPADLIRHARAALAGFKCPTSVDVVDVLPRNPSGKVLKRELRAPYWQGRDRQI